MSELIGYNVRIDMENKDILTLSEPCCGSGGMVIAFAESMKETGYNYQHQLFVEAIDIDELCFKMTYIQLALLGIPAKVIRGDSLSMRYYEVLYTPFYFLGNFSKKLEYKNKFEKSENLTFYDESKEGNVAQLTLFNF